MTKSTITRERAEQLANFKGAPVTRQEEQELARIALAAMDSEPVAVVEPSDYVTAAQLVGDGPARKAVHELYEGALRIGDKLYRHAQPASERDQVRSEHAEWSQATFGNVGPVGPLKHLSKEALEAAAKPGDLSEWADMQFLLWDAQRRAGITDEQITQAMIEKLAVNKQREWPEPKDGEPRLHIKAQPAQVTEREPIAWLNDAYLARGVVDGEAGSEDAGPGYIPVYREAQPAPVVAEDVRQALRKMDDEIIAELDAEESACRAAMLQDEPVTTANKLANYLVQSPIDHGYRKGCECSGCKTTVRICAELAGWIPVSERMPDDSSDVLCTAEFDGPGDWRKKVGYWHEGKWVVYGASWTPTHWMPLPAAPQEVK